MPKNSFVSVEDLKLDLSNFRTVPQKSEFHAVQAMISISPAWFWALMESLIDDGFLPTENILVLKNDGGQSELTIKEGNRRIAALKLIFGLIPKKHITIPSNIESKIANIPEEWKKINNKVPCAVFEFREKLVVDRIVRLAHGKGEKAGRDHWTSVARARHNRDVNNVSEPELDLLETYLKKGRNLNDQQSERWAGEYPLTVLEEALKKIALRFGVTSTLDLANKYPAVSHRDALENIILNIGLQEIRFDTIRRNADFAADFGLPPMPTQTGGSGSGASGTGGAASGSKGGQGGTGSSQGNQGGTGAASGAGSKGNSKPAAVAINDPRAVTRALRKFKPKGNHREKIVSLQKEALKLKLVHNPIAFCFILRSMFEISAKLYCDDHKGPGCPTSKTPKGEDKKLVEVLGDVTNHLTGSKKNQAKLKELHGAITELRKKDGLLSVTSMNQLVHNPKFSITASDISSLFGNIFPLLDEMNK